MKKSNYYAQFKNDDGEIREMEKQQEVLEKEAGKYLQSKSEEEQTALQIPNQKVVVKNSTQTSTEKK